jgi:hypothetical protein
MWLLLKTFTCPHLWRNVFVVANNAKTSVVRFVAADNLGSVWVSLDCCEMNGEVLKRTYPDQLDFETIVKREKIIAQAN